MRLFRTLTLSLIFHILLAWGLAKLPVIKPKAPTPPSIVELIETSPESSTEEDANQKQFVRSARPPKELLTNQKKEARFASEDEQYVLEERKARASGMTANRSQSGGQEQERPSAGPESKTHASTERPPQRELDLKPKSPLEQGLDRELGQELAASDDGDLRVGGLKPQPRSPQSEETAADGSKPLDLPNFMGAERGTSTVGESLPDDVKFGDFTALNTDRHLYYSFYARMEEAVRPPWVRHARAALYAYEVGARTLRGTETWTTRLELILDREGRFVRAIMKQSSGIPSLDAAPVEAFREAARFPNPPQEMVKEDGYIHVYCQFTVNVGPQYAARGEQ